MKITMITLFYFLGLNLGFWLGLLIGYNLRKQKEVKKEE